MTNADMIIVKDVRVSFPHLFRRPVFNGEEGKCGAALMFDPKKHAGAIHAIEKSIEELRKAKFKGRKLPSDKVCLRDGDDSGRPEYAGLKVMSANNKGKPLVIAGDGRNVVTDEDDCRIYAGCYANAKLRLRAQDNQWGKRINADLISIQFARDGKPLDGSYVSVEDATSGFEAIEEDDFLAA